MSKIIGYNLLAEETLAELINFVTIEMTFGWQPLGGPTYGKNPDGSLVFVQAVVKYQS